jgi:hypothetical protein
MLLVNDEDHHDHGDDIYRIDESSISLETQHPTSSTTTTTKRNIFQETRFKKSESSTTPPEKKLYRAFIGIYEQEVRNGKYANMDITAKYTGYWLEGRLWPSGPHTCTLRSDSPSGR